MVCLALALAPSCAALHVWCLYIMLSKSYLPRIGDWKAGVFYKSSCTVRKKPSVTLFNPFPSQRHLANSPHIHWDHHLSVTHLLQLISADLRVAQKLLENDSVIFRFEEMDPVFRKIQWSPRLLGQSELIHELFSDVLAAPKSQMNYELTPPMCGLQLSKLLLCGHIFHNLKALPECLLRNCSKPEPTGCRKESSASLASKQCFRKLKQKTWIVEAMIFLQVVSVRDAESMAMNQMNPKEYFLKHAIVAQSVQTTNHLLIIILVPGGYRFEFSRSIWVP